MDKHQKGFAPIMIVLIILILSGVVGAGYYLTNKQVPGKTACTEEAKICPDGSSVGRSGPNCEFAACPEANKDKTVLSCDQTCKNKGYASGSCVGFSVTPDGFAQQTAYKETHTLIEGETSDCYVPEGLVGINKGCYCD